MMQSVYDLERVYALEQQEREARLRFAQGIRVPYGAGHRFARLAFVASVLALFRLA